VPLVSHFAGCTICNPPEGKLSEEIITACNSEFAKVYALAKCRMGRVFFPELPTCSYDAQDLAWVRIRLGER
jgi:hypothetical protein